MEYEASVEQLHSAGLTLRKLTTVGRSHTQLNTHLVYVSPVLPVVVEPLPHHAHDLRESHHVVGEVGNLRHEGTAGAPWVVGGGLSNLGSHTQ